MARPTQADDIKDPPNPLKPPAAAPYHAQLQAGFGQEPWEQAAAICADKYDGTRAHKA